MDEDIRERVARAFQAEAMADIALRRYRSRDRRQVKSTRVAIVEDLAKGLIAQFERDPALVGALKSDYVHLPEVIIDEIESGPPGSGIPG
jgi:hypothetical protein